MDSRCVEAPYRLNLSEPPHTHLYDTVSKHGIRGFDRSCYVYSWHVVYILAAIRLSILNAPTMGSIHYFNQMLVELVFSPGKPAGVLTHFESGDGDSAGVYRLAGRV